MSKNLTVDTIKIKDGAISSVAVALGGNISQTNSDQDIVVAIVPTVSTTNVYLQLIASLTYIGNGSGSGLISVYSATDTVAISD